MHNTDTEQSPIPFWADFFERTKGQLPHFILPSMEIALPYYQFYLAGLSRGIHFEIILSGGGGMTVCFHCENSALIKAHKLQQVAQEIAVKLPAKQFTLSKVTDALIEISAAADSTLTAIPLLIQLINGVSPAIYQALRQPIPSSKEKRNLTPLIIYDVSLREEETKLREELSLATRPERLQRMLPEEKSLLRTKHNRWWNLRAFRNITLQGYRLDFSLIFSKGGWTSETQKESISGSGSTMEQTVVTREVITRCLNIYQIQSLLDVPCGDFNWMRHVNLNGVRYLGGDIVPQLIARNRELYVKENMEFKVLDIKADSLEGYELILVRDLFIHLTFEEIFASLANIALSSCRYVLINNYMNLENTELKGAYHLVNLLAPPFSLPAPLCVFYEKIPAHPQRALCLWARESIPCHYIGVE